MISPSQGDVGRQATWTAKADNRFHKHTNTNPGPMLCTWEKAERFHVSINFVNSVGILASLVFFRPFDRVAPFLVSHDSMIKVNVSTRPELDMPPGAVATSVRLNPSTVNIT